MKIIIIGCGKVGSALAEELTMENHEVAIVDISAQKLQEVGEDLDALQIHGNGSSINVLMDAGVTSADLVIAVTGSDELNLLCCLVAKNLGKCHTVARVRNPIYNKEINLMKESLGISMIINPEMATAAEIARLLRFPSAIKIDPFAKGKVELLKFRLKPEFRLDGKSIVAILSKNPLTCSWLMFRSRLSSLLYRSFACSFRESTSRSRLLIFSIRLTIFCLSSSDN